VLHGKFLLAGVFLEGPIRIFSSSSILTLTVICVGKFLLAGVFWKDPSGFFAPPTFSPSPSSMLVSSYWLGILVGPIRIVCTSSILTLTFICVGKFLLASVFWEDQSGSSAPPPFSPSPSSVLVSFYWLAYSGRTNQDLLHLLHSHPHRHLCCMVSSYWPTYSGSSYWLAYSGVTCTEAFNQNLLHLLPHSHCHQCW
jgi:hypothetical protein